MASGTLTIVGLGPGSWDDVTVAARQVLDAASIITFRTLRHPTINTLRERRPELDVRSFDDYYESTDNWDDLYTRMAETLLDDADQGHDIVYAVPGHPLVGEASVRHLRARAPAHGIIPRFISGISFLEPICTALGFDPIADGLQIVDATELVGALPQEIAGMLTTGRPAIISQIYNRRMASGAKLALLEIFPADWEVTLIRSAGLPEEYVRALPLSDIDHDDFADHLTSLYVPSLPAISLRSLRTPEALRYIVARLRAPDGCPWDRKQTHASLSRYVLEEAAETADAIEEIEQDPLHLAEELGDVLLQVYLHAEIAQEEELFTIGDIFEAITSKLIRRHPHVFGDVSVSNADQVVQNWEVIKRNERAANGVDTKRESLLRSIPRNGSALSNAHDIQRKAVKAGFDWPTIGDWVMKVREEVDELAAESSSTRRLDELGDVLFSLVAIARRFEIDANNALRIANEKFRQRFMHMEELCRERGLTFEHLDRDAQLALWNEAKSAVSGKDSYAE
jgi:tetrapyrrole methylase family protein / MazG family protein